MGETWVLSLGWQGPREKGTATHSSILAWRIPWTEEPGGLQSMGRKESDRIEQLTLTLKSENEIAKIHLFKSVKHLKMPGSY